MQERARKRRLERKATQADIATAAGLSRSCYSLWENGRLNVLPATVERILDATLTKMLGASGQDRKALTGHATYEMLDDYTHEYHRMREIVERVAQGIFD